MDSYRAREIMESRGVIEVLYRGLPVWIENILDETAQVTYLKSQRREDVPLSELEEGIGIENCCM